MMFLWTHLPISICSSDDNVVSQIEEVAVAEIVRKNTAVMHGEIGK